MTFDTLKYDSWISVVPCMDLRLAQIIKTENPWWNVWSLWDSLRVPRLYVWSPRNLPLLAISRFRVMQGFEIAGLCSMGIFLGHECASMFLIFDRKYRKYTINRWSAVCAPMVIVRRAGLLLSQQDFEWRWSVPLFQCLTVLEFSFILFDLCLLITFFNFIMNYVPIVTFWIFTYHKIWILSIMFCFIWSYWIIYFLACL